MTRVAIVTPILPIPQDPTRGRFIHETASALAQVATVKVFLQQAAYPKLPQALSSRHPSHVVEGDMTLNGLDVCARTYPALPLISRMANGLACGLSLKRPLQAFAPDIVIGYWVYPEGAGALWAARQLGVPAVIGALGTDIHMRSGLNARMTRRTLQAADAVITVSQAMTRYTQETYGVDGGHITTIVNGFNTQIFYPRPREAARAAASLTADDKLILYVGRLIEAKGLRELLQAFTSLKTSLPSEHQPRVRLALIGEGAMKQELQTLITANGLQDNVMLLGGRSPSEVAEWMSAADVMTLPSWSEGYPNVLVESLACGCPIVATSVGGIPEIVHERNGLMVPAREAAPLQAALAEALDRTWDREAIALASTRTWHDVATETLKVCEATIQAHPRSAQAPHKHPVARR